jgi:hypothetical protein
VWKSLGSLFSERHPVARCQRLLACLSPQSLESPWPRNCAFAEESQLRSSEQSATIAAIRFVVFVFVFGRRQGFGLPQVFLTFTIARHVVQMSSPLYPRFFRFLIRALDIQSPLKLRWVTERAICASAQLKEHHGCHWFQNAVNKNVTLFPQKEDLFGTVALQFFSS